MNAAAARIVGGGECDASGQCLSHSGSFQTVLFEITPPAAGIQFLQRKVDLAPEGGEITLELASVSQVTGEVTSVERPCPFLFQDETGQQLATASNRSLPVLLTLTPSTTVLGLYSPRAVVESALDQVSFGFSLSVPPGQYDVYIQPKQQVNESCPAPPQLLRGQTINAGAVTFGFKLFEPARFPFHVTWPLGDGALDGWVADMLDPISGRVLSNRVTLALGTGKIDYFANLAYFPVVDGMKSHTGDELIRLSPPDGVTAPLIFLARNGLGLIASDHDVVLSEFTALPSPVRVQGQVTALPAPRPVAATVTLVATTISGIAPGVLASFTRSVDVSESGDFEVDLLPGTYRVSAVPRTELNAALGSRGDSKLASASREWMVASSPSLQAGKVIELGQAPNVHGQAFAGPTALATAQVSAITSPASVQVNVLEKALPDLLAQPDSAAFVPRASTGNVAVDGSFSFNADPGTFDVSVRPLPSTGFAWLVLPRVPIDFAATDVDLGRQEAPLPVSYRGTVTLPGTSGPIRVPGALIRAYIYMTGDSYTVDPGRADSVLQVAETRADEAGNFTVLIPAALNSWNGVITP